MSIRFDEPMSDGAKAAIEEFFGKPQYLDSRTALFDRPVAGMRKHFTYLANIAQQPAHISIHDVGDVVEMDDGLYRLTNKDGWVLYEPPSWQCDQCWEDFPMDHNQIIHGMQQYCSVDCSYLNGWVDT